MGIIPKSPIFTTTAFGSSSHLPRGIQTGPGCSPTFFYKQKATKWEIIFIFGSLLYACSMDLSLLDAIKALDDQEKALNLAHLGNALSLLKKSLPQDSWAGVYLVGEGRLVLGPFQGTPACEIIAFGKGMVGSAYEQKKTLFIDDVANFPGYICCDASAQSELCSPILKNEKIVAILDIDRPDHHDFKNDVPFYEEVAKTLGTWID